MDPRSDTTFWRIVGPKKLQEWTDERLKIQVGTAFMQQLPVTSGAMHCLLLWGAVVNSKGRWGLCIPKCKWSAFTPSLEEEQLCQNRISFELISHSRLSRKNSASQFYTRIIHKESTHRGGKREGATRSEHTSKEGKQLDICFLWPSRHQAMSAWGDFSSGGVPLCSLTSIFRTGVVY